MREWGGGIGKGEDVPEELFFTARDQTICCSDPSLAEDKGLQLIATAQQRADPENLQQTWDGKLTLLQTSHDWQCPAWVKLPRAARYFAGNGNAHLPMLQRSSLGDTARV